MSYDMRIISCKDFLRVDPQGHWDMNASRRLLCDAILAAIHSGVPRVLLDTREATTDMTVAQLVKLSLACKELASPEEPVRIAVLNQPQDGFDRAAFVETLGQVPGQSIKAFRSFEDAFDWLRSK